MMLMLTASPPSQLSLTTQQARPQESTAAPKRLRSLGLTLAPGRCFAEEGSPANHTYEIHSGAMLLSRFTWNGQRHIVGILGVGDVFGRALSPIHDCTLEPLTRTVLHPLDKAIASDREAQMRFVLEHMQRQLRACRDHAVRLQCRTAETKLASLLLSLPPKTSEGTSFEGRTNASTRIFLSLTDISDCLNLRPETISRLLSRFKSMGLIAKPARDALHILDVDRLSQIAHPLD